VQTNRQDKADKTNQMQPCHCHVKVTLAAITALNSDKRQYTDSVWRQLKRQQATIDKVGLH